MATVAPIYTANNCQAAYGLDWSLAVFWRQLKGQVRMALELLEVFSGQTDIDKNGLTCLSCNSPLARRPNMDGVFRNAVAAACLFRACDAPRRCPSERGSSPTRRRSRRGSASDARSSASRANRSRGPSRTVHGRGLERGCFDGEVNCVGSIRERATPAASRTRASRSVSAA